MFIDACAIIALLSEEPEAERVSNAIAAAKKPFTSPVVQRHSELTPFRHEELTPMPIASQAVRG